VHPYQLIRRKRDGTALEPAELAAFLSGYLAGTVSDYQMAAMLMAIYFRGLEEPELSALVEAMIGSGEVLDLSDLPGAKVDKHSTGGVGDKASLVLAPLVAALGVRVPRMSGRGLGHTGGTVDKLESIPGFRTDISAAAARRQLATVGCVLMTQTERIAPLDRRLYALRDVTATVESLPLIAASIMSKKLAEGIDGLVLDIKRGSGAFVPELERALELARMMIGIGERHGCRVVALLTAMDRPLGHAVGNALEVEEAVLALQGGGPEDLRTLTVALAAEMLEVAGSARGVEARRQAAAALDDGRALSLMERVIEAQGGNPGVLEDPGILPQAPIRRVFEADRDGSIAALDVKAIGDAAVVLGAGRLAVGAPVDPAVGFHITARAGDRVSRGEPLATIHARSEQAAAVAEAALRAAVPIAREPGDAPLPLVSHRVDRDGVLELA
jgi:pyrimidine-nucleoside phosphorylase